MKIRPRFDHWIPKRLGVSGIVLYPFVLFAPSRSQVSLSLLQHEMIHVRQVRELGWFRFYLSYGVEYLRHRIRLHDHEQAYRAIRFEAEAYAGEITVSLTATEREELGFGERLA